MIGISSDRFERNNRKEANRVILIMIAILCLLAITLLLMYNSMREAIDTMLELYIQGCVETVIFKLTPQHIDGLFGMRIIKTSNLCYVSI